MLQKQEHHLANFETKYGIKDISVFKQSLRYTDQSVPSILYSSEVATIYTSHERQLYSCFTCNTFARCYV